jgi:hypothetical protein
LRVHRRQANPWILPRGASAKDILLAPVLVVSNEFEPALISGERAIKIVKRRTTRTDLAGHRKMTVYPMPRVMNVPNKTPAGMYVSTPAGERSSKFVVRIA